MAEFNIRVNDLKNDGAHPVAEAVVLLKTLINDEGTIYDLDLAITEAVANVARHAYPNDTTGPLALCIRTVPGKELEITITDQGGGMDCIDAQPELPSPESESGRGIPLMNSLCDQVSFRCQGKTNTVTLIKIIPPALWRTE